MHQRYFERSAFALQFTLDQCLTKNTCQNRFSVQFPQLQLCQVSASALTTPNSKSMSQVHPTIGKVSHAAHCHQEDFRPPPHVVCMCRARRGGGLGQRQQQEVAINPLPLRSASRYPRHWSTAARRSSTKTPGPVRLERPPATRVCFWTHAHAHNRAARDFHHTECFWAGNGAAPRVAHVGKVRVGAQQVNDSRRRRFPTRISRR
jgi:hypothetical protein